MQRDPTTPKRFSVSGLLPSSQSKARQKKEDQVLEKAAKIPLTTRNVEEFFGDRDGDGVEVVSCGKEKIEDWLRRLG